MEGVAEHVAEVQKQEAEGVIARVHQMGEAIALDRTAKMSNAIQNDAVNLFNHFNYSMKRKLCQPLLTLI